MAQQVLESGMKVRLLEGEEVIDEAVVGLIQDNVNTEGQKVSLKSLQRYPDKVTDFGSFVDDKGQVYWKMLYPDPFTGRVCFSQRGPKYEVQPTGVDD